MTSTGRTPRDSEEMEAMQRFPVVTICGSIRYFTEMIGIAQRWTADGWIVLMPFVVKGGQEGDEKFNKMLDEMHRRKIDLADRVIIFGDHIGESVTSEIIYCVRANKPMQYYQIQMP